ncbi:hypothetical protein ILYODFUR_013388, partial [Ilyodon furcidens]
MNNMLKQELHTPTRWGEDDETKVMWVYYGEETPDPVVPSFSEHLDSQLLSEGFISLWISLTTVCTFRTRTKLAASRFLQLQDPGISVTCFFLHLKHRHLSSIRLSPRSQPRRQLNVLPSQVKTLNLSIPGGSSYNNFLVFPVLIPDYFADNKIRKLSLLSVLCMW